LKNFYTEIFFSRKIDFPSQKNSDKFFLREKPKRAQKLFLIDLMREKNQILVQKE